MTSSLRRVWLGVAVVCCSATEGARPAFEGQQQGTWRAAGACQSAYKQGGATKCTAAGTTGGENVGGGGGPGGGRTCGPQCSYDLHSVLDCDGKVVQQCSGTDGCDDASGTCKNACDVAKTTKQSVGCDYYATFMDQYLNSACFAAFVANTWDT